MAAPVPVPSANLIPGRNYIIKSRFSDLTGSGTFVGHFWDNIIDMPQFINLSNNLGYPNISDPQVLASSVYQYFDPQAGGKRRRRAASRRQRKQSRSRSRRNRR